MGLRNGDQEPDTPTVEVQAGVHASSTTGNYESNRSVAALTYIRLLPVESALCLFSDNHTAVSFGYPWRQSLRLFCQE